MLRIGAMNMMLHGVDNPNIDYKDSLSEVNTDKEKFTLVLVLLALRGPANISLNHTNKNKK